ARVYETTGRVTEVKTGMGEPEFRAADIPVVIGQGDGKSIDIKSMISCSIDLAGRELGLNLISMGNPHAVHFLQDSPEDFPLSELGPKVENLEMFPNRVNFEVARILDRRQIEARVWERGVGETLACGSGACAIAVAARLHGYIDNEVAIKLPGGVLEVEWDGKGEVFLKGPAETVFKGDWPDGKNN
ncbi:MAG: diaminopimelate epimerase, partial [Dehalococcoidales bacterium]|nr:diaminopimelate epimerase [Dehalococcoidales bacterium]